MNESKYILFFLGSLGAFNGFVIGIYLLLLARKKNLPTFFLGCLLLALSTRIGKSVFVYFNPALPRIYLQIGLSACFLIGPALYYFIRSSLEQTTHFPRSWTLQIAALVGIILLTGILFPYAVYPRYWNHYIVYFIYGEWLLYVIAAAVALRRQWAKLFARTFPSPRGLASQEKWLLAIYAGNALIFLSFLLSLLARQSDIYFSGALIFSFLLYLVIFVLLYRKKTNDFFNTVPTRYAVKKISDHDAATLLNTLDQLMVEKEVYKNPNLTLGELAKAINLSSHQLSQILNDNLGKNFTSFINEYRINAACKMIAANHPFSLEAIGYEVGFNSKSTYYTSFKKIKGTTPLLYKERLKRNKVS
jgi:AraC-like DNA-binding protein